MSRKRKKPKRRFRGERLSAADLRFVERLVEECPPESRETIRRALRAISGRDFWRTMAATPDTS
jgi:hypothetical protein